MLRRGPSPRHPLRDVLERRAMLNWDPVKLMEESARTKERLDGPESLISSFKDEARKILMKIPLIGEEEEGPEYVGVTARNCLCP